MLAGITNKTAKTFSPTQTILSISSRTNKRIFKTISPEKIQKNVPFTNQDWKSKNPEWHKNYEKTYYPKRVNYALNYTAK